MPVDSELLEILACPACDSRPAVTVCRLKPDVASTLVEKYREKFRDEEPVVTEGLHCAACGNVYAIVSDIPILLVEEALTSDARA